MTKDRVDNVLEKLNKDRVPQFMIVGGELIMPLPQGEFIYFPRGLPHMYVNEEELRVILECNQGKVYGAGNIRMPKQKC